MICLFAEYGVNYCCVKIMLNHSVFNWGQNSGRGGEKIFNRGHGYFWPGQGPEIYAIFIYDLMLQRQTL